MARQRPLGQAAALSVKALSKMLRILDKLERAKAIDRVLKMLTKMEKTVDSLEQLMELLSNIQLLSEVFSGKPKKKKKAKKKHA